MNLNEYCSKLEPPKQAINENHWELVKRESVTFHHDNIRLQVSLVTRKKLLQLGWYVFIHLLISPKITYLHY